MIIYKIRNKETGLFSTGGVNPRWRPTGKVWTTRAGLSNHLNLVSRLNHYYGDAEIIIYDLTLSAKTIAVTSYVNQRKV